MTPSDLKLLLLLVNIAIGTADKELQLKTIVNELNYEFKIEFIVLLNLNDTGDLGNYQTLLRTSEKPLVVYNDGSTKITPLYQQHSQNSLTIVWLHDMRYLQDNLKFLDRLLWKIHFTEILFVAKEMQQHELLAMFQQCWVKGFTNVLLHFENNTLFTYHPYPKINVVELPDVKAYTDKQHLIDFRGYKMQVPFREHAPRCFSYTNRLGHVVRTGYWYKMVDLFITHYNGITENFDVSMEDTQSQTAILKMAAQVNFSFVPTTMYFSDYYSNSDVFYLSKVVVICSMPQEIDRSLYITISFEMYVWLLCILTLIVFVFIMSLYRKLFRNTWSLHITILEALTTILFIPSVYLRKRSTLMYILHFLPLLSGFLITNFYSCNLASMQTTKVFEGRIETLLDILKTKKRILESTNDVNNTLSLDSIPQSIKNRLITTDSVDTYLELRTNLNVSAYFYTGSDDLVNFYLFQQKYLNRPFATFIPQPLHYRPFFIVMPHRSPLLLHFNRYLKYIQENGLYQKYLNDAEWDGVMGGELRFFATTNWKEPLNLVYFFYPFILLAIGFSCAIIVFIVEIYHMAKK